MSEHITFQFQSDAMTVTEMKDRLEELENLGFGNAQMYGGCLKKLTTGVKAKALEQVIINSLNESPVAYLKFK